MTTELDREFATLADNLREVTVRVVDAGDRGAGSGVVWNRDGTIVTNAHVVRGSSARVIWEDGTSLEAYVVRRDDARDLALLRAAATARPVARVRRAAVRPGEIVVAVGNPRGLTGAFSTGLVRGCNARWVMSSVRLAPGNSGGPLADAAGRVVGINSMVAGDLGLAIPSDVVAAFVDDRSPRLGIALARGVAAVGNRRLPALVITAVEADSPAERSGIVLGDAIVAIEGTPLDDIADIPRALAGARALGVVRSGKRETLALDRAGSLAA